MVRLSFRLIRSMMMLICLVQLLVASILSSCLYMHLIGINKFTTIVLMEPNRTALYLLISVIVLILIMLYLVCELVRVNKLENTISKMKIINESSEEALKLLRCHRHDFLNHLQVIMGYAHFGRNNEMIEYIKDLNQNLNEVRKISGIDMPQLSIILLSKKEEAQLSGIKLKYSLDITSLVMVNQVDLVRILTNLIDNAIFELGNEYASDKIINVEISSTKNKLYIVVHNTGSLIMDKCKIFEYGFSTKGSKGSGLGLYSVKNLIENKYRGKIEVESSEEGGAKFKIVI